MPSLAHQDSGTAAGRSPGSTPGQHPDSTRSVPGLGGRGGAAVATDRRRGDAQRAGGASPATDRGLLGLAQRGDLGLALLPGLTAEDELAQDGLALGVDDDLLAPIDLPEEDLLAQGVLDVALDPVLIRS